MHLFHPGFLIDRTIVTASPFVQYMALDISIKSLPSTLADLAFGRVEQKGK
jgi:hypothetical protein